jgi:hypothetical protein
MRTSRKSDALGCGLVIDRLSSSIKRQEVLPNVKLLLIELDPYQSDDCEMHLLLLDYGLRWLM